MALLNPYLNFDGSARDAIEFYASVFGGEPTISTFGDLQVPGVDASEADKVMHSQLSTPAGFTVMAADMPTSMKEHLSPNGTLSLSGDEADELRGYWDKLAAGGQVTMPLDQAPWGDYFGQLVDKFGVAWMVNISGSGTQG